MEILIRFFFATAPLFVLLCTNALAIAPIEYKITINPTDLSGFNVEMRVPAAPANVRVAMAVHPEYDDRYWPYIENFSAADGRGRSLQFAKQEDTVWRIENARGDMVIRYRLRLLPQQGTHRDAWKPFLT